MLPRRARGDELMKDAGRRHSLLTSASSSIKAPIGGRCCGPSRETAASSARMAQFLAPPPLGKTATAKRVVPS